MVRVLLCSFSLVFSLSGIAKAESYGMQFQWPLKGLQPSTNQASGQNPGPEENVFTDPSTGHNIPALTVTSPDFFFNGYYLEFNEVVNFSGGVNGPGYNLETSNNCVDQPSPCSYPASIPGNAGDFEFKVSDVSGNNIDWSDPDKIISFSLDLVDVPAIPQGSVALYVEIFETREDGSLAYDNGPFAPPAYGDYIMISVNGSSLTTSPLNVNLRSDATIVRLKPRSWHGENETRLSNDIPENMILGIKKMKTFSMTPPEDAEF